MNTGIQDAANLGWKLAAVVNGSAPERVLETYQEERHPVGKMVLRSSGALIRLAMARSVLARFSRNVVVGALLRFGPTARRATGTITGLGISYRRRGDGPRVGERASDVALRDGGRLYEALRRGRFVLVVPPGFRVTDPGAADVVTAAEDADALLVRPDGYVAWAGRDESWRAALSRWVAPDLVAA
jgi:hypothetical protein